MAASAIITKELHDIYSDVFSDIGLFKDTYSLQVREDTKAYQALLRYVV